MDAIAAGILVADLFSAPIERVPRPGELAVSERFLPGAGGCAVNVAADLRILGRSVAVQGKVGGDVFGDFVVRELERQGIDTTGVKRSAACATSSTFILNVRGEDRRYIHTIGANADFAAADIDLRPARLLYVGGFLAMPRIAAGDLGAVLREAKRRGMITVLDVVIPAGSAVSFASVEPALPCTDYFLPNEDEARLLTGCADAREQARRLAQANAQCAVVITRGRHGSLARRGGDVIETPAFEVEPVDESGAGDAFAAGLIAGILEGWPLDRSLRLAAVVGASCTRALGCTAGVVGFEEAVRWMEAWTCR
jgi:sugar/nucleoside kinase (ribokinase family)